MPKWLWSLIVLLAFIVETFLIGDSLRNIIVEGDRKRKTWGWLSVEFAGFFILLSVIW